MKTLLRTLQGMWSPNLQQKAEKRMTQLIAAIQKVNRIKDIEPTVLKNREAKTKDYEEILERQEAERNEFALMATNTDIEILEKFCKEQKIL